MYIMPAKKNQKTNVDEVKNTQEMKSSTTVVEPQSVAQPVAPVVADTSAVQPVAPAKKQRGGSKKQATGAEVAPVVEVVAEVAPVASKAKRGGKAKAVATPLETPLATAPVTDAPLETKTGGAKSRARKSKTVVTDTPGVTDVTPPKRQRKSKKVEETATTATGGSVEASDASQLEGVTDDEKHVRSFKVRLPGSENFEGRFTGLTPYQAANKALSKYFRAGDKTHGEVTFSICESTRKSKKSVYTYVGQRHRLADPVKYKIQDGREIVKNFKNSLKKVKKTDTSDVQSVSAPSASA